MYRLIIPLFLLIITQGYSQSNEPVYLLLDENNKVTDYETYTKKCNSFLYDCKLIDRDSVQVYTMQQLYEFGKLNDLENNQIRSLLSSITNKNYNFNKTLIIYLKDTLVGYTYHPTLREKYSYRKDSIYYNGKYIVSKPGKNSNISKDTVTTKWYNKKFKQRYRSNYSRYLGSRKGYDLNQKKCIKQFEKYNADAIYFFYQNFNYEYEPKYFTFHKVPTTIKKVFFKNNNTGYVILKPDGNYFYYDSMKEKKVKELLSNDWTKYINDYNWVKENLPEKSIKGFFNAIEYKYTSNYHCYSRTRSGY